MAIFQNDNRIGAVKMNFEKPKQKIMDFKNDRSKNRKSWYLKTIMALGRKVMISKTKRKTAEQTEKNGI